MLLFSYFLLVGLSASLTLKTLSGNTPTVLEPTIWTTYTSLLNPKLYLNGSSVNPASRIMFDIVTQF